MLDHLEGRLPSMIEENPDEGEFWSEFAGEADHIEDLTPSSECEHVRGRIDAMLAKAGLIPSEGFD
ncbi:MAG TPA: hypothetical protein VFA81_07745 [Burkholderiales bacterium]|nr:hypothetical protein [Burkholderiales bacterium]